MLLTRLAPWGCCLCLIGSLAAQPDPFEPNNEMGQATPLVVDAPMLPFARINPDDPGASRPDRDWFRWEAKNQIAYQVTLDSDSAAGHGIELTLFDQQGGVISSLTSPGDNHKVRLALIPRQDQPVFVLVRAVLPFFFPSYKLTIDSVSPDDLVDINEPNNTWSQATFLNTLSPAPQGAPGVLLTPPGQANADVDWFRFYAHADRVIDLELRPKQGNPGLRLHRARGDTPALPLSVLESRDEDGSRVLRATFIAPETDWYYLRVGVLAAIEFSQYTIRATEARYERLMAPQDGLAITPPWIMAAPNVLWGVETGPCCGIAALDLDTRETTTLIPGDAFPHGVADLDGLPCGDLLIAAVGEFGNQLEQWHVTPPAFRRVIGAGVTRNPIRVAVYDRLLYIADDPDPALPAGEGNPARLLQVPYDLVDQPAAYRQVAQGWRATLDMEVDQHGTLFLSTSEGDPLVHKLLRYDAALDKVRQLNTPVRLTGQPFALDQDGGLYFWHKPDCCTERLARVDSNDGSLLADFSLDGRTFQYVEPTFDMDSRRLYLYGYRFLADRALYVQEVDHLGIERPIRLLPDADRDGLADALETWPKQPQHTNRYLPDTDGDGLADGAEDWNANGIRDGEETSPLLADSDGDGLDDGIEVFFWGSDPLDPQSPAESWIDQDGDHLPARFDPDDTNRDSDGDRIDDGYEAVQLGLDAATLANVTVPLGDVSGDGETGNLDVLMIQALFLNRLAPEDVLVQYGDVNLDGAVTNIDALITQAFFNNVVGVLPFRQ